MRYLILLLILFLLTGCGKYIGYASQYLYDDYGYRYRVICINGIQYIKTGYRLSAYWDIDFDDRPILRRCESN